jgi:phosphonate transport system permease protein
MPRLIGLSMYRLDINFRESAVLGLVGAGGIGATLNTAFDRYEFDTAAAILLIIIVHRHGAGIRLRHIRAEGAVMPSLPTAAVRRLSGNCATATRRSALGGLAVAVALFVWCWQRISEATTWFFVWDAPRIAADIGGRAWPPRWSYIDNLWGAALGHAQHRDAGHAARAGDGGSGGLSGGPQHHAERCFIRPVALFIIVASRSINSLIWALLLVAIIGPGVFAGLSPSPSARSVSAPSCSTRPSRRSTDPGRGDHRHRRQPLQVMAYGIVPQIMPAFAGITCSAGTSTSANPPCSALSARAASGCSLQASLNTLAWPQVTVILLLILAAVVISEWVSAKVRGAII